jgi:hypothetical protein
MKLLIFPIAAIIAVVLVAFHAERLGSYRAFISRNSTTTNTFVQPDCNEHGGIKYRFFALGKTYWGQSYFPDKPCLEISPTYTFTVYYDPTDPTVNSNMSPLRAYDYHLEQFFGWISLGIFAIGAYLIEQFRGKR